MKKYILTLVTIGAALPLFAFNFNEGNLVLDADLKKEISNQIIASAKESVKSETTLNKAQEHHLLALIKGRVKDTMRDIERNAGLRPRVMTRKFIQEQKQQKAKYENMQEWGIPYQLFTYISKNFNLNRVIAPSVICKHRDGETGIDINFDYKEGLATVSYTYDHNYISGHPINIKHSVFTK